MPRKKKDRHPPPAPVRPINCAFCQKKLDPQTDQVTFIGMGKGRDGPRFFHAVCSAKTTDNEDNPCLQNGIAWARKFTGHEPVFFTYEQWKATPVGRHVSTTRAENGRYELRLTEWHLNCFIFLETKHAANAAKAKEIIERWQTEWSLSPEDLPDIDQSERDARRNKEVQRIEIMSEPENPAAEATVEWPEKLTEELRRHSDIHHEHCLANVLTRGDDCRSCRISRGMEMLHAIAVWVPVIEQAFDTMRMAKNSQPSGFLMSEPRRIFDDAMKSLCQALGLKPNNEKHNEAARKRIEEDIRHARTLIEEHAIST